MAQKCRVGGTVYNITGGRTRVSGTAYGIKNGRTRVDGTAYDVAFASGKTVDTLPVGGSVIDVKDGVETEYIVIHMGNPNPQDYIMDGNVVWLMQKDIPEKRAWSTGTKLYNNSFVDKYLDEDYPGLCSATLNEHIQDVTIPYVSSQSGTVSSGSNGLQVRAFSLSAYEVGWSTQTDRYYPEVGTVLRYFEARPETDQGRIATDELGEAYPWWLRDPYKSGTYIAYVTSNGGPDKRSPTQQRTGIRPVVVVDGDMLLDENNCIIG